MAGRESDHTGRLYDSGYKQ